MKVAQLKEIDRLEQNLATLATIGSTSPYVGLFGTVWGIMSAFQGLGNVQQATLAMVAPGIAEALIATAMGLFAAIPAVIAYNRYADQVGRLELRYDTFMEEFSTILQRHAGAQASPRSRSMTPRRTRKLMGEINVVPVHRRHARAAHHLHGDGAAPEPGRQGRPAGDRGARPIDPDPTMIVLSVEPTGAMYLNLGDPEASRSTPERVRRTRRRSHAPGTRAPRTCQGRQGRPVRPRRRGHGAAAAGRCQEGRFRHAARPA